MPEVNHGNVQFAGDVRTVTSTVVSYDPDADTDRFTKVAFTPLEKQSDQKSDKPASHPATPQKA
jgi:hypothetical protein